MGIGPTFECTPETLHVLARRFRVDTVPPASSDEPWPIELAIRGRLGAVRCQGYARGHTTRLWLTCAHGTNPLLWIPEMRLLTQVERSLLESQATPCTWEDFTRDSPYAHREPPAR